MISPELHMVIASIKAKIALINEIDAIESIEQYARERREMLQAKFGKSNTSTEKL